jgi:peptide/nickel transport system ATP-binding protein
MAPFLEVHNLKKYFSTPRGLLHAVDDVSFILEKGKTLGVVGESGCGKSTLGRAVIHLLPHDAGRIIFEGRDISHVTPGQLKEVRRNMQMIFQDPFSSLNPRMSVSQIISEPLMIYGIHRDSRDALMARTLELMETVGLARRYENTYPHELDGGRRQRIGIARALALNPKFIVCDEPVSALDVSIQAQILNLMQDLQKQMNLSFVFITHDLSVIKHISDHICVMYLGKIIEKAETKELFKNPWHPYTQALLSAIPRIKLRKKRNRIILKGEISSPIEPKPGCRFAPRCLYAKEQCGMETPSLEETAAGHFVSCHYVNEIDQLKGADE